MTATSSSSSSTSSTSSPSSSSTATWGARRLREARAGAERTRARMLREVEEALRVDPDLPEEERVARDSRALALLASTARDLRAHADELLAVARPNRAWGAPVEEAERLLAELRAEGEDVLARVAPVLAGTLAEVALRLLRDPWTLALRVARGEEVAELRVARRAAEGVDLASFVLDSVAERYGAPLAVLAPRPELLLAYAQIEELRARVEEALRLAEAHIAREAEDVTERELGRLRVNGDPRPQRATDRARDALLLALRSGTVADLARVARGAAEELPRGGRVGRRVVALLLDLLDRSRDLARAEGEEAGDLLAVKVEEALLLDRLAGRAAGRPSIVAEDRRRSGPRASRGAPGGGRVVYA